MQTRPELILLQKSMVIVEGVARDLDPALNVWVAAEPVAKEWVEANLSLLGRLRDAQRSVEMIGDVLMRTPGLLKQAEQAVIGLADMSRTGLKLDDKTVEDIAARSRRSRLSDVALWIGALSLLVIALKLLGAP
jgi:ubiquinone biosynthesis protein